MALHRDATCGASSVTLGSMDVVSFVSSSRFAVLSSPHTHTHTHQASLAPPGNSPKIHTHQHRRTIRCTREQTQPPLLHTVLAHVAMPFHQRSTNGSYVSESMPSVWTRAKRVRRNLRTRHVVRGRHTTLVRHRTRASTFVNTMPSVEHQVKSVGDSSPKCLQMERLDFLR